VVTGCYDSIIRIFDSGNETLVSSLRGHAKGIISFSWTIENKLLSGSWDATARIWDIESSTCLYILDSHENGVHVLGLPSGMIVTTSTGEAVNGKPANFQVRFWDSTGKKVGDSLRDHQGSIRSICPIPTLDGFATTSNDGTIAVRTGDGSIVASLVHPLQDDGIPPFILDW
jgi:WD40 repeat protein